MRTDDVIRRTEKKRLKRADGTIIEVTVRIDMSLPKDDRITCVLPEGTIARIFTRGEYIADGTRERLEIVE